MSGIVSIFDRGGNSVDRDVFRSALGQIDHRGPDGRGAWRGGPVALGHQQLQSTPESRVDDQPYRDGDLVITADARLDNRDELFGALDISSRDEPVPDSHLLLKAYREWGTDCVDHLVGAFAFVVWDGNAERVFCARDHMGVKPLYYHQSDGVFAVASEMTPLLALPSISQTLDEVHVGDFLISRFGDGSTTFYEDLTRFQPAYAATVESKNTEKWQYWNLDPTRTIELESDAAYERRFRRLFEQAVGCRLRRNTPVGATLSGGLDSSSITVVARDLLPDSEPIHTLSMVFDDAPRSDEREYIETIASRPGIKPQYIPLDDRGVLVNKEDMFGWIDEPPFNPMQYGGWEMAKRAADTDIRTVLTGTLGDAAVGYGLGLFQHLFRTGQWRDLWATLNDFSDGLTIGIPELFFDFALKPLVPKPFVRLYRSLRQAPVLEQRWNPALSDEFVDRIGLHSRCKRLYEDRSLLGQHPRRIQHDSIMSSIPIRNLEHANKTYARHGVEQRHPFTDIRLLEFSLAMPATQQLLDGWTRSIVRRALDDLLPDKIRHRTWKTMLDHGLHNSLMNDNDVLQRCLATPGTLENYVNIEQLRRIHYRFYNAESPDPVEAKVLWRCLSLWVWLNRRTATKPSHDVSRRNPSEQ